MICETHQPSVRMNTLILHYPPPNLLFCTRTSNGMRVHGSCTIRTALPQIHARIDQKRTVRLTNTSLQSRWGKAGGPVGPPVPYATSRPSLALGYDLPSHPPGEGFFTPVSPAAARFNASWISGSVRPLPSRNVIRDVNDDSLTFGSRRKRTALCSSSSLLPDEDAMVCDD